MELAKIMLVQQSIQENKKMRQILVDAGYGVQVYRSAADLLVVTKLQIPDMIMLHVDLADNVSGIDACRLIREEKQLKNIPLVVLDGEYDEMNEILSLEMGADSYFASPFSSRALLARIKAMLRRVSAYEELANHQDVITVKDIVIDNIRHEVTKKGVPLSLTYKEFELLSVLAAHKNQVLTREALLDKVWGYDYLGATRTVDVHIRSLRKILSDDEKKYIETIRGVGYKIKGE